MCPPLLLAIPGIIASAASSASAAIAGLSAGQVALGIGAVSAAASVATSVSAANAQTEQNKRAAETAAKARALEAAKIGAAGRQAAEAATSKNLQTERARLTAQGRAHTQAVESGGQGNFLTSIQRNINLQAGDRVSAIKAQQALAEEQRFYSNAASNQRLAGRIAGLPQAPNLGLAITSDIVGAAGTGLSTYGALKK
jgi:hypothetical protein